ncbi:hypothetical protein EVAR_30598_1 [Eumeta japonica]|uniref:Uncharacterized protein n=1 Tax=Eumeta variegata TaxID=151549 RepID=A0A4C1W9E7_EUMVA|nr:hypothetical protein EVAR_30598_1 [Eumeta japonica]
MSASILASSFALPPSVSWAGGGDRRVISKRLRLYNESSPRPSKGYCKVCRITRTAKTFASKCHDRIQVQGKYKTTSRRPKSLLGVSATGIFRLRGVPAALKAEAGTLNNTIAEGATRDL